MSTLLGNAVRIAKQNSLKIELFRRSDGVSIEIELPVGCGFGVVMISFPKSHRRAAKLRQQVKTVAYGSSYNYQTWYYLIPNTQEALDKARALGARVTRGKKPHILFSVTKGVVTELGRLA